MQAKHTLALAALVATVGAASAQTVPAEQWVGAPLATTGAVKRADVVAELQRSARAPSAPAEQWVGSLASAGTPAGTLSRAEVVADLNLWRRAGLESASIANTTDSASPRYAQQLAAYTRARGSDVYTAEVQRVQGGANAVAGTPSVNAQ
ncbi:MULTISPECIES: hypothetical protein [unclassified Variovorax]|uniref:hypothetical protein n=1 Tax=unclassified Variovorax TaxID=663243 RepID=UPI00257727E1|nr:MULTISPECIES: hypothetical protein [unclassified Variovorax]MDM0089863.1 hypothetical protein [Variovorax sp. J22G40]MDM0148471.1 hypothetical protein [Variovorax sp. J2P1-31]